MCVRLCDIHSRFRRVTFKKLRSAPPIGNKSPDGIFVSPVVVATHTRTKPKKTCSNTIQHLPRQTYHSQPNTTGIHLSCTMCLCSTAQNAGRRSRTYRENEQKKKKKKNTKRIITYAWQQVDRFRKVTDPPYADWYILIMKYLRSRCAKPSHRKYYIRCDIIFSLSFFNFFLL